MTRDEACRRLWPGPMNYDRSNKPYERRISGHKRCCMAQTRRNFAGKIAIKPGELENLDPPAEGGVRVEYRKGKRVDPSVSSGGPLK